MAVDIKKEDAYGNETPKTISDFPMSEYDLGIALEAFQTGLLRSLSICIPACVRSFDPNTNTAEVMPLIKQGIYNGEWHYLPRKPFKVSVLSIKRGGFTLSLPLFKGDTGWVISSDRDTFQLKQKDALTSAVLSEDRSDPILDEDYQTKPNQPMLHSLSRGFFIPDNWGPFQQYRYKDCPQLSLTNSIYLGSSMDTNDMRIDTPTKKYQKGISYESTETASLVIGKSGACIAGSSPMPIGKRAHVAVLGQQAEMYARSKLGLSAVDVDSDAVTIKQTKFQENYEGSDEETHPAKVFANVTIKPNNLSIRVQDAGAEDGEEKIFSLGATNGNLNVQTTGNVNANIRGKVNYSVNKNINLRTGIINVRSHGEIRLQTRSGNFRVLAEGIYMVAEQTRIVSKLETSIVGEGIAINSGNNLDISSKEFLRMNGREVMVAGRRHIYLTSPDIGIGVSGNLDVSATGPTQMRFKARSARSSFQVVMKERGSRVGFQTEKRHSPIALLTDAKNSSITLKTGDSPIRIYGSGKGSIGIEAASRNVSIKAGNNILISGRQTVRIYSQGKVSIVSEGKLNLSGDINLSGAVTVATSLKVTGDTYVEGSLYVKTADGSWKR